MSGVKNTFVFVGNWNRYQRGASGIGIFRFDERSGEMTLLNAIAPDVINDTACLDHRRGILYCTDQRYTRPRTALGGEGLIHAFRIDPLSGSLTEINARPSCGALPAHVAVDASGAYLIATHHTDRVAVNKVIKGADGKFRMSLDYDDATTVLFRLNSDGAIGEVADVYVHKGAGGPSPKQTHPQLHSVMRSPSGQFFAVTDKGNDQIFMFRINREQETLEVCGGKAFQSIAGSSPRYIAFHPSRPYLFVNHEEQAIVSALRYDDEGVLSTVATASVLPDDYKGDGHVMQSDIRIHPTGKYLYCLIRRLNAVAVLAVDQDTGAIDKIQFVTLACSEPRGCAISPDGRFLVIAALAGQSVLVYAIGNDGILSDSGFKVSQPCPSNVAFFEHSI